MSSGKGKSKSSGEASVSMGVNKMTLECLGTGAMQASPGRNVSSYALNSDSNILLFDCGEATQNQILRSKGVSLGKISGIFITHLHGDHSYGLPGLLTSMSGPRDSAERAFAEQAQKKKKQKSCCEPERLPPLVIVGPPGLRAFIRSALLVSHSILGYRYVIHELVLPCEGEDEQTQHGKYCPNFSAYCPPAAENEQDPQDIEADERGVYAIPCPDGRLRVTAARIVHSVPCVGYVVTELDSPGTFDMKTYGPLINANKLFLEQQGFKPAQKAIGYIKSGHCITLPDGRVLEPPASRTGRKVCILGDTSDASRLHTMALGADVVVHEATLLSNALTFAETQFVGATAEQWMEWAEHGAGDAVIDEDVTSSPDVPMVDDPEAAEKGHSTPITAARFAAATQCRALVLTHFSPRYKPGNREEESLFVRQALMAWSHQARHAGAGSSVSNPTSRTPGQVFIATDHLTLNITRRVGGSQGTGHCIVKE